MQGVLRGVILRCIVQGFQQRASLRMSKESRMPTNGDQPNRKKTTVALRPLDRADERTCRFALFKGKLKVALFLRLLSTTCCGRNTRAVVSRHALTFTVKQDRCTGVALLPPANHNLSVTSSYQSAVQRLCCPSARRRWCLRVILHRSSSDGTPGTWLLCCS